MEKYDLFLLLESETQLTGVSVPPIIYNEWSNHQNLDIQGAFYCLLTDSKFSNYLKPFPEFSEFRDFLMRYFERCIIEDIESDWADSRYSAGWDIARWVSVWKKDESISDLQLKPFYEWLHSLRRHSSKKIREAVEITIFERVLIPKC